MKKLLALYVPKATRIYSVYLAVSFFLIFATGLFPIDEISKSVIKGFVITLPVVIFYFSAETYLPSSMNWILLTPTSKKSIILSNIIINLFKIFLIFLGAFILGSYAYDWELDTLFFSVLKSGSHFEMKDLLELLSFQLTADAYLAIIIFISLFLSLVSFLFGSSWIPDYSSVSFFANPVKYIHRNGHWFLMIIFAYFTISDNPLALYLFPPVIKYPMIICLGLYLGVTSTLKSLRTYYSVNNVRIIMLILFILNSASYYFLISREFQNQNQTLNTKIELVNLLGPIAKDRRVQVINELKESSPSITFLGRSDVKELFASKTNEFDILKNDWHNQCEKSQDHHCRLSSYLEHSDSNQKSQLLNLGCSNDLGSCFLLYRMKNIPNEMTNKAKDRLEKSCVTGKEKSLACQEYIRVKPQTN